MDIFNFALILLIIGWIPNTETKFSFSFFICFVFLLFISIIVDGIIIEHHLLGKYLDIYKSYSQAISNSSSLSSPIILCVLLIIDTAKRSQKIINNTKVTRAISDEKYKDVMGAYAALLTAPIVVPILLFLYFHYYYVF